MEAVVVSVMFRTPVGSCKLYGLWWWWFCVAGGDGVFDCVGFFLGCSAKIPIKLFFPGFYMFEFDRKWQLAVLLAGGQLAMAGG